MDPASQAFKPDVRARRVKQAKARGVVLPDYLKDEVVGATNHVAAPLADDLVAALRLVGSLTEDEVQAQTDMIINQQQDAEGLVATFCHEDDGEVPCSILAVSQGGEEELEPSLFQELINGKIKPP